ncbi:hypothetical protein ABPG75_000190 [Micractinium tetrahymenae]
MTALGCAQAALALAASGTAALEICRPTPLVLGSGRLLAAHVAAPGRYKRHGPRFDQGAGGTTGSLHHPAGRLSSRVPGARRQGQRAPLLCAAPCAAAALCGLVACHGRDYEERSPLSFGAASVASRLPPNRQPADFHWSTGGGLAGVLTQPLLPALQQHLASADGAAVLRLVRN